jgi:hypothetical protein
LPIVTLHVQPSSTLSFTSTIYIPSTVGLGLRYRHHIAAIPDFFTTSFLAPYTHSPSPAVIAVRLHRLRSPTSSGRSCSHHRSLELAFLQSLVTLSFLASEVSFAVYDEANTAHSTSLFLRRPISSSLNWYTTSSKARTTSTFYTSQPPANFRSCPTSHSFQREALV